MLECLAKPRPPARSPQSILAQNKKIIIIIQKLRAIHGGHWAPGPCRHPDGGTANTHSNGAQMSSVLVLVPAGASCLFLLLLLLSSITKKPTKNSPLAPSPGLSKSAPAQPHFGPTMVRMVRIPWTSTVPDHPFFTFFFGQPPRPVSTPACLVTCLNLIPLHQELGPSNYIIMSYSSRGRARI